MGCFSGPDVSESGLVLALDAGNQKSLNIPTQEDHGYANWYCLVSGTATYSIANSSGGSIYENNAGSITTLVTATGPQRGTISVTAGRTYYGSVPINLVVEDQQHSIVPLTMMGTQFWSIVVRNNPSTYYVYSPYQAATVNFYDNTTGGLTGTPTSTLSLSAGQSGTFTSNNLTNHWISSNTPILASTTQTGADKTILSPMSTYVYQRYAASYNTTNSTTPTTVASNVVYDSTYKVMVMNIADGSGGDCAQGLGLEYLSDTYSWGNVLSDYAIASPYSGTTITTYYWSGSAWVVWDTHSLSGTITSPAYVQRDGTQGPGVTATLISGGAANMASGATLWKWEGNQPFYLCINDSADDEFSVLGWLSARNTTPRSGNTWTDITGRGNTGTLTNGPIYSSVNGGSIVFDGVDDYVSAPNTSLIHRTSNWSYSCWVNFNGTPGAGTIFENGSWTNCLLIRFETNVITIYSMSSFWGSFSLSPTLGMWYKLDFIRNGNNIYFYLNGSYSQSISFTADIQPSSNLFIGMSQHSAGQCFNGRISQASIYNRALSAAEIQQNFNATRGRYGI